MKLLSLAIVLASVTVILSNCGPGEQVEPKPVLEFAANPGFVFEDTTLGGNENFTVGIRASHTINMTSMKVEISVNGGQPVVPANCPVCDSTFKTKNFDYNYVGSTGGSTGTEVWTFTIIDEKANETSKSITITNFGTGGASLVEIEQDNDGKTLKVYNFQGPNSGAYDLKVGGNLFSADSNSSKDIQDSTTTAEITTWPARWTSRNGTMFKKMTNYNWANVTNSAHLLAAWNDVAGGGSLIILVKKGDVYVAKLRGLDEYVLIEITDVVSTSVDNTDYVQFRFKKKDQ